MSKEHAAAAPNAFETKSKSDTVFLGHPAGLGWLSASEFWERFSYYGMQTLLVLYLTHYLLQPGHIEQVWGFATFHRLLQWVYGTQSQMALASNSAQLYAGLFLVSPLAGGFLAAKTARHDRVAASGLLTAAACPLSASSTSRRTMRPPGPVPWM